jgi:hypothetical protein
MEKSLLPGFDLYESKGKLFYFKLLRTILCIRCFLEGEHLKKVMPTISTQSFFSLARVMKQMLNCQYPALLPILFS